MHYRPSGVLVVATLLATTISVATGEDWNGWRGPRHDGTAAADQSLPTEWSADKNILWKAPIPGRGHSSPTVIGDRVFLATAEEDRETRSILCLNKSTGKVDWTTDVHKGKVTPFKNKKGSDASSTIACDGERLYINFLHDGGMVTSALSMTGEVLWQQRICDYIVHQAFGSSPIVHDQLVIVIGDSKAGGALAGLNQKTGEIVWKESRPKLPNYASPIIMKVDGKDQLLLTGCDLVSSFDPTTGEKLWEVAGATTECVTSTLVCGNLMFTSGGYPKNHISAVRCDGTGKVEWENGTRAYVPSMLVKEGYLYAVTDSGVATCWECATGKELWKGRLGGTFSGSPVLVGDRIFATNESGETFLFKANPKEFELIAQNKLGDEVFATPTICESRIYNRVASRDGDQRQEFLYCIGNAK